MITFDNPLLVFSDGRVYATEHLLTFAYLFFIVLAILVIYVPAFIMFGRYFIQKIKSKRSKK